MASRLIRVRVLRTLPLAGRFAVKNEIVWLHPLDAERLVASEYVELAERNPTPVAAPRGRWIEPETR